MIRFLLKLHSCIIALLAGSEYMGCFNTPLFSHLDATLDFRLNCVDCTWGIRPILAFISSSSDAGIDCWLGLSIVPVSDAIQDLVSFYSIVCCLCLLSVVCVCCLLYVSVVCCLCLLSVVCVCCPVSLNWLLSVEQKLSSLGKSFHPGPR